MPAIKGGSGFGKFQSLQKLKLLHGKNNNQLSLYIGSHDGFEKRVLLLLKTNHLLHHDFWIVKIILSQTSSHTYKQVCKYYSYEEIPNLLRSSFNDGSGLDIYQFIATDSVSKSR
jgi:hypothetical protein